MKPIKLPPTFTSYQYLQAGDGACSQCTALLKDPNVRRSSWYWDSSGIHVIKDPLQVLLDPPQPPFRIYITKTKKKHGWIRIINKENYSREIFWIGFDEDLLLVNRAELSELVTFARVLRAKGLSKKELRLGEPNIRSFDKLSIEERAKLRSLSTNPLWEVVVFCLS